MLRDSTSRREPSFRGAHRARASRLRATSRSNWVTARRQDASAVLARPTSNRPAYASFYVISAFRAPLKPMAGSRTCRPIVRQLWLPNNRDPRVTAFLGWAFLLAIREHRVDP